MVNLTLMQKNIDNGKVQMTSSSEHIMSIHPKKPWPSSDPSAVIRNTTDIELTSAYFTFWSMMLITKGFDLN